MIAWTPVKSSNVKEVGYDAAAQQLHVKFHSGNTAGPYPATAAQHRDFLQAPSIGKHYHANFRSKRKAA